MTILGTSGHRPQKAGGNPLKLRLLAQLDLMQEQPSSLIVGMAVGWDQAMAQAAIDVGIPFTAAIPFEGHEDRWPMPIQEAYRELLKKAAKVVYVSPPGYDVEKMWKRNRWIVERMDRATVLWDGFEDSGTAHFVRHARLAGIEPTNLWDRWQEFRHQL